jgi:polyphosphate kinase
MNFIPLDELISGNIDLLFNGCQIRECSTFRITRDMNFSIADKSAEDMLEEMLDALQRNAKRPVIRLELSEKMSQTGRKWLAGKTGLNKQNIFTIKGLINLKSCFQLCALDRPDLCYPPMPPLPPPQSVAWSTAPSRVLPNTPRKRSWPSSPRVRSTT